jgi:hypothetical protein
VSRRKMFVTIDTPAQPAVPESFDKDGNKIAGKPAKPQGRDHGKVFVLTEMPAELAEPWCTQAGLLLAQAAGIEQAPDAGEGAGALAALLPSVRLKNLRESKALQDPSLKAWRDCVKYQHLPNQDPQPLFEGDACQIEEMSTFSLLRAKVLELHVNFFTSGGESTSV